MNSKGIIKRLKEEGWKKVGGKGDHEKFKVIDENIHTVLRRIFVRIQGVVVRV